MSYIFCCRLQLFFGVNELQQGEEYNMKLS